MKNRLLPNGGNLFVLSCFYLCTKNPLFKILWYIKSPKREHKNTQSVGVSIDDFVPSIFFAPNLYPRKRFLPRLG